MYDPSIMVNVQHLSKRFGRTVALADVCFEVGPGEIVGLLGPNGAGKTTTMRILSCFVPPSGGTVTIADLDVIEDSLEIRGRIGYLPETVALYPEMRVREYLRFRAGLKGVRARALKARVNDVIALCGLKGAEHRIIGQLSRGYRKRVMLADCLVHDPALLILDEPTLGLDPNHARDVRELIKTLAENHTIILSSGNLAEVEAVCRRMLILDNGTIIAADAPGALSARVSAGTQVVMDIRAPARAVLVELEEIPEIVQISWESEEEWTSFLLECEKGADIRPRLFRMAAEQNWPVRELSVKRTTLEEAFMALTAGGGSGGRRVPESEAPTQRVTPINGGSAP
ncbi:MAG: ATP-binding cassette domain-containing protein [Kiritimatiellae bacterium]|nr:ATP-binding cassette domain-containing protein [Kiritimatiellia bacterium]